MPKIEMSKDHQFSKEEAKSKVDNLAKDLEQRYGVKSSWSGDKLEFKRTGVKGHVELAENRVMVFINLSMVLSPMKPKVEAKLRENLEKEFA